MNILQLAYYDQLNQNKGLGGWFDSVCASNGIADSNEKKTESALDEKSAWQIKLDALKNGKQAAEWNSLKTQLANYESYIEEQVALLEQENILARELGLGAFCKNAKARREKSEEALSDAEEALGIVKGSYETLEKQQTEGIKLASEGLETSIATLEAIKSQVSAVQTKIGKYKAQRDAEALVNEAAGLTEAGNESQTTVNSAGILTTNNLPIILGSVLAVGALIYVSKNKTKKKETKKVLV